MQTHYTKRSIELVAIGSDGSTYIIERRSRSLPCDDGEHAFFYCCVQDGRPVSWLGESRYALPDGTELRAIACRLADAPTAH